MNGIELNNLVLLVSSEREHGCPSLGRISGHGVARRKWCGASLAGGDLPYIEEGRLFDQFKLDQSWDSRYDTSEEVLRTAITRNGGEKLWLP